MSTRARGRPVEGVEFAFLAGVRPALEGLRVIATDSCEEGIRLRTSK